MPSLSLPRARRRLAEARTTAVRLFVVFLGLPRRTQYSSCINKSIIRSTSCSLQYRFRDRCIRGPSPGGGVRAVLQNSPRNGPSCTSMGPGNSKGPKLTVVKANLGCREQPIHTQAAHEKIAQSARHQGGLGTRLILNSAGSSWQTGHRCRSKVTGAIVPRG